MAGNPMQLGGFSSMFDDRHKMVSSFAMLTQLQEHMQNQDLRRASLEQNLANQRLEAESMGINNQFNRAKLDEFTEMAPTRKRAAQLSLDNEALQQKLLENDLEWKPKLFQQQQEEFGLRKQKFEEDIRSMRTAEKMEAKRFELATKLAEVDIEQKGLDKSLRQFHLKSAEEDRANQLAAQALELKTKTLQNRMLDFQSQQLDVNSALDRFKYYQASPIEGRKFLKKHFPEQFDGMPDRFEDDDIKDFAAITQLARAAGDQMEIPGMPVNPIKAQINQATQILFDRIKNKNLKDKDGKSIEETLQAVGNSERKATAKEAKKIYNNGQLTSSDDLSDRLKYSFSQEKSSYRRPYAQGVKSGFLGGSIDDAENEVVENSPTGPEIRALKNSEFNAKTNKKAWVRSHGGVNYYNSNISDKKDRELFQNAVSGKAGVDGTVEQVVAYRTAVNEIAESLAAGDKENGRDILDRYDKKFGGKFFTPKQLKSLYELAKNFGWTDSESK